MRGSRAGARRVPAAAAEQAGDGPLRYMDLVNAITADLPPLPIVELGTPVLAAPARPLSDSRVILITSAGVRRREEPSFLPTNDMSFRRIAREVPSGELTPSHPTPVRGPAERDIDVVLPRDRLEELVARGAVGASAPVQLSFLGTIKRLTELVTTMAPAMLVAAREAGADLAVLVPL